MILTVLLFIIVILNLLACMLPFVGMTLLFMYDGATVYNMETIIFFIKCALFVISFSFLLYLTLNLIFGFSVFKKSLRLKHYRLSLRYANLLREPFERIQDTLKIYSTKLMISPDHEIKASIIASLGRSVICISIGMLDALRVRTKTDEEFKKAITAIIATQGIKIAKCVYFGRQIIEINDAVISLVKNCIKLVATVIGRVFSFIPIFGDPLSKILRFVCSIIEAFIDGVNSILFGVYYGAVKIVELNKRFTFEKQAAKIVGGESISLALSLTNEAKFSLLAGPKRFNKRVKKIEKIQASREVVRFSGGRWKIGLMMAIFFSAVIYLGYEIKIWKAWDFTQEVLVNQKLLLP